MDIMNSLRNMPQAVKAIAGIILLMVVLFSAPCRDYLFWFYNGWWYADVVVTYMKHKKFCGFRVGFRKFTYVLVFDFLLLCFGTTISMIWPCIQSYVFEMDMIVIRIIYIRCFQYLILVSRH